MSDVELYKPKRDARGRILPGQKPINRTGLEPRLARMVRDLGALTPKAIKTLERLLDDANPSAALGAAKEILDRNLGKVKQQVQVDVTSTHVLHLQALEELAARKRAQLLEAQSSQVIDVTPVSVSASVSDNPDITLDRIVSHDDRDVIGAIVTDAIAEAPRPPEAQGAAACAPTTPSTHENPTTDPSEKT